VCSFYKSDLDRQQLQAQLPLLLSLIQEAQKSEERELTIHNIVKVIGALYSSAAGILSSLGYNEATFSDASNERLLLEVIFCLAKAKKPLRATMSQQRLNNLSVLHVHKNETDLLKLAEFGNEFVSIREQRFRMFGRFE